MTTRPKKTDIINPKTPTLKAFPHHDRQTRNDIITSIIGM